MIYNNEVLKFCYEGLMPQLKKYNFFIILKFRIGKYTYIGRLLQIDYLSYSITFDMGNGITQQFKIIRIDEMEIVGNAQHDKQHNAWEWKKYFNYPKVNTTQKKNKEVL